jgi:hypothetical protein
MLHSLQRLCAQEAQLGGFKKTDSLKWKVSEMLADIGPSITITSATNVRFFKSRRILVLLAEWKFLCLQIKHV